MEDLSAVDILAEYEFPVPVWVMEDALGKRYSTGLRRLSFDVEMPSIGPPMGGAPSSLPAIPPTPPRASVAKVADTVWTQRYSAFIPPSLEPAVAVLRIAVVGVEGPVYKDREWLTPDQQLIQEIDHWFDRVRTWVEIVTGQDLDPGHRVYDNEVVGTGLTFIKPAMSGPQFMTISTPHIRPLTEQEWGMIMECVKVGQEPPLEEVLSRDARAANRRGSNRRAMVDAATALEIVLRRYVLGRSSDLPPKQLKRLSDRTALGDYISIAEQSHWSLSISFDKLREVNNLRNDAAHRGKEPDSFAAARAIQTMIDFLGEYGTFRRSSEREADGGEFVVAGEI